MATMYKFVSYTGLDCSAFFFWDFFFFFVLSTGYFSYLFSIPRALVLHFSFFPLP